MALALAFEDAKPNQVKIEGSASEGTRGTSYKTKFFGSRENPNFPHASLTRRDPGRVSSAHFHTHDQFQVVIEGKGKLGRHILSPSYCVHFSRAYTPYGPFATDAIVPLTFFVLRAHYDAGSQRLPQKRDQLNGVADRQPWQITRTVEFSDPQSRTAAADSVLTPIPDMEDVDGLAAYTLAMKPNAQACTPDPSHGDGQYVVVVEGGFRHDSKEHEAPALVFITPNEGAYQIQAGTKGLRALVLNFPRPHARSGVVASAQATAGFRRLQCALCAFVYDEARGLPAEGIAPGTLWQDVPEDWSCPDCSASKGDFHGVEIWKPHDSRSYD